MRVLLFVAILAAALLAETKTISVKLIDPIAVGKTQTARAQFESLSGEAGEDFRRAVFLGRSTHEKLSNGETRVSISWNEVRSGAKSAAVEPFITRVSTSQPSIPAGFSLKARGDTAALTAAVRNMVEGRESSTGSTGGTSSADSGTKSADSTVDGSGWVNGTSPSGTSKSAASGLAGGSTSGSSYTPPTTSTGSTGSTGDSQATSSKICKPIIDLGANTYTITEPDENGGCQPTATVSSIYETAKGCPQTIDYDQKLVKIATRKYSTPTASETPVTPCANSGKTATLQETYNGCQWVSDMDNEVAVLQKRYFFQWMGEPVYVTGCVNSDRTAPLAEFKGDRGCQPLIDEQAGTYQETASEKGLCKPTGPIMKIYYDENQCEPFVDFDKAEVNLAAIPYVNKNTGKEFVGACERTNTVLALKSTTDGCSAVLDKSTETAIDQVRWYYTLGSVNKYVTGCTNSDVVKPITTYREYNGVCKNLVDFSQMRVQPKFRTMTRLGEKTLEVRGCEFDDNNVSLQPTYEGCSQRHDFLTNTTYEQERLYYLWDGDRNYVSGCRDSASVFYPHYLTTAGCNPTNTNGKVIVNKRVAYNQSDGTVGYATGCRPVTDELAIQQEFCGYEHDFVTNQSYRKIRDYYVEPTTSERIYLTQCTRDDNNFPHKQETGGWIHDNAKLQSTQKVRTYFVDTVTGETVYPNGTDWVVGVPVPYANKGIYQRVKTNLGTVDSVDIEKLSTRYTYAGNPLDTSLGTPWAGSTHYYSITWITSEGVPSSCSNKNAGWGFNHKAIGGHTLNPTMQCGIVRGKAKIYRMKEEADYIRVDGSTYSIELRNWYQVQP